MKVGDYVEEKGILIGPQGGRRAGGQTARNALTAARDHPNGRSGAAEPAERGEAHPREEDAVEEDSDGTKEPDPPDPKGGGRTAKGKPKTLQTVTRSSSGKTPKGKTTSTRAEGAARVKTSDVIGHPPVGGGLYQSKLQNLCGSAEEMGFTMTLAGSQSYLERVSRGEPPKGDADLLEGAAMDCVEGKEGRALDVEKRTRAGESSSDSEQEGVARRSSKMIVMTGTVLEIAVVMEMDESTVEVDARGEEEGGSPMMEEVERSFLREDIEHVTPGVLCLEELGPIGTGEIPNEERYVRTHPSQEDIDFYGDLVRGTNAATAVEVYEDIVEVGSKLWDQPFYEQVFWLLKEELPCPKHYNLGVGGCTLVNEGKAKTTHRVKCMRSGSTFSMGHPLVREYIATKFDELAEEAPEFFDEYVKAHTVVPRRLPEKTTRKAAPKVAFARRIPRGVSRLAITAPQSEGVVIRREEIEAVSQGFQSQIDGGFRQFWEMTQLMKEESERRFKAVSHEYRSLQEGLKGYALAIERAPAMALPIEYPDLQQQIRELRAEAATQKLEEDKRSKAQAAEILNLKGELLAQKEIFGQKIDLLRKEQNSAVSQISKEMAGAKRVICYKFGMSDSCWKMQEKTNKEGGKGFEARLSAQAGTISTQANTIKMLTEKIEKLEWKVCDTDTNWKQAEERNRVMANKAMASMQSCQVAYQMGPETNWMDTMGEAHELLQLRIREELHNQEGHLEGRMVALEATMGTLPAETSAQLEMFSKEVSGALTTHAAVAHKHREETRAKQEELSKSLSILLLEGNEGGNLNSWKADRPQVYAAIKKLQNLAKVFGTLEETQPGSTMAANLHTSKGSLAKFLVLEKELEQNATEMEVMSKSIQKLQKGLGSIIVEGVDQRFKELVEANRRTQSELLELRALIPPKETDREAKSALMQKNLEKQEKTLKWVLSVINDKSITAPNAKEAEAAIATPKTNEPSSEAEVIRGTAKVVVAETPKRVTASGKVGRGGASQPKAQTAEKSAPKGTSTGITILKRNLDGKESIRAAATGTPTLSGPIQKEKEVVAATTQPPKAKEALTPMIGKDQGKVTQTDPRAESKGETPRPRSPETDVPKSFSKAVGSRTRTTVTAQTLTKGVKDLADSPPAGSANLDKETQINVVASVMSTVREPVMPKSKQARKFKKVVLSAEAIRRMLKGLPEVEVVWIEMPALKASSVDVRQQLLSAAGIPTREAKGSFPNGGAGTMMCVEAERAAEVTSILATAGVEVSNPGRSRFETILEKGSLGALQTEAARIQSLRTSLPEYLRFARSALKERQTELKAAIAKSAKKTPTNNKNE